MKEKLEKLIQGKAGEKFEQFFKLTDTLSLAEKYYPNCIDKTNFNVGCPGIMNPLGEIVPVEGKWGFGGCKADKVMRIKQLNCALILVDAIADGFESSAFVSAYTESLNAHGQSMFWNIVHNGKIDPSVKSKLVQAYLDGKKNGEITYQHNEKDHAASNGEVHATSTQIIEKYVLTTVNMLATNFGIESKEYKISEEKYDFEVQKDCEDVEEKIKYFKIDDSKYNKHKVIEEENYSTALQDTLLEFAAEFSNICGYKIGIEAKHKLFLTTIGKLYDSKLDSTELYKELTGNAELYGLSTYKVYADQLVKAYEAYVDHRNVGHKEFLDVHNNTHFDSHYFEQINKINIDLTKLQEDMEPAYKIIGEIIECTIM